MLSSQLTWLWAVLFGLGVFVVVYGLAKPTAAKKRVAIPERDRIRGGLGTNLAYRIAVGYGQPNAPLEQRLKAANWFWAPGELNPPDLQAPFFTVRGYQAACFHQALLYGGLALGAGLWLAYLLEYPLFLGLGVGLLGALLGYTGPGAQLRAAVQRRQHLMTIEMAFRLPELAAVVSTGKSIQQALRELLQQPGGPFVTEIARLMRHYEVTTSFSAAVTATAHHNDFPPLTEFLNQLGLVEDRGGSLAPTLNVQARAAQERLRRHLIEQGQRNASRMKMPVVIAATLVTLALVGGPPLWILLTNL